MLDVRKAIQHQATSITQNNHRHPTTSTQPARLATKVSHCHKKLIADR
jgi:hypothetical protein